MKTQEELEEDIRELLVLNNMDINIHNYPELISSSASLGFDTGGLAVLVRQVYGSTDWRAYDRIYEMLRNSDALARGVFYKKDARLIIESVKEELSAHKVTAYIISLISREPYYLKPRELTPPDWNSFRNCWMTDEAWQRHQLRTEPVEWCDEQASSLEELGWLLFRKKEASMEYLDSKLYLPPLITLLTRNVARTREFEKVFDKVKDKEIRYLVILYRLNKDLPYRFDGKEYRSIRELMDGACKSHTAFVKLLSDFGKGYLHIWLKESGAPEAAYLGSNLGKNSFLELLYKVSPHYPFFINKIKYASPGALAAAAQKEGGLWGDIYAAHDNRELSVWFAALGKDEWNALLDKELKLITDAGLYTDDECKLAFVQRLINLIDHTQELPTVSIMPARLSFPQVEAGKTITANLRIELKTGCFLKLQVAPDQLTDGLSLDKQQIKLFRLVDNIQADLQVSIDPTMFPKDTLYQTSILVKSVYEEIRVPIEISVTFPKKMYIRELIRWGLMGGAFFWFVGFIIPSAADFDVEIDSWNYYPLSAFGDHNSAVAGDYIALLVMFWGFRFAYRFIKRTYKTTIR